MDHDQLEHGIVVAAAGIGPAVAGREVEGDRPGKRHDGKGDAGGGHPGEPPAPVERAGEQPARQQGRSADQRRQHLHVEGDTQQRHRRHQGKAASAQRHRSRQQQEEDQPGIGVVGAVDRDGNGHHGQKQRGANAGRHAERLAHQPIEQRHRGDAGQRLRQVDRPAAIAQHPGEGRLDPEGDRRLVERDVARRIEGIVEEQPAALQHAAHAGGIVGGAEAVILQPPQPQHGCDQQDGCDCRSFTPSSGTPSSGLRFRQSPFPRTVYAG